MEEQPKTASPFSNESRNIYVIEHLTEALLSLMEEKPLSAISISELCAAAGVGRTSFYRNFETREDILRARVEQLLGGMAAELKKEPALPLDRFIYQVFSHLEANRDFYGLVHRRGCTYLLKDVLLDLCGFEPEQEVVAAYSSAYVAFFLYGWIETWLRRGMRETAAELASYLEDVR